MIRKKLLTKNAILKKLGELEAEDASYNKPEMVFIEQTEEAKWKVTEHIFRGKKRERKAVTFDVSSPDEYLKQNPILDCPIIVDDMALNHEDLLVMFNALVKIASEEELNQLVDLLSAALESENVEALDEFEKQLIKKYQDQLLQMIGFNSVDYSRLNREQLLKLANWEGN